MTDAPILKTIKDVPIVSTGTYQLGSGEQTFTEDDLAAAIAAQDDPAVVAPRLKLGHVDPRFDGEPCFGKVVDMRLDDHGQTIYADLVGVPAWLADIMPVAYPSRSIEGYMNATTASGKTYGLVITALSLLGVTLPGVETLDDLPLLFGEEQPPELKVEAGSQINAKINDMPPIDKQIFGSASIEDVRRAYYDTLTSDQMYWWVRQIYLSPDELIVDDDNGNLYRVPFGVNNDSVTFGDPQPVKIEYVNASTGDRTVVFSENEKARPKKEQLMLEKIKAKLGLAAGASEDEVMASLDEQLSDHETQSEEVEDVTSEEVEELEEAEEVVEESEEVSDDNATDVEASGGVVIDRATLEQLKKDAAMGLQARKLQIKQEIEQIVEDAVKAGKIIPGRKKHFSDLMQKDFDGTKQYLSKLEAGSIPVDEIGSAADTDISASDDSYPSEWLRLNKKES